MPTNTTIFDPGFFVRNRRALQKRCQTDTPILVTANGLLQRGADSSYAFSQDANFWYLTGINEPDITLVMDGDDEFLIVPVREQNRETFDGSVDISALTARSGIGKVVDEINGWRHLDQLLSKPKKLLMPAAAATYLEQYGMYVNPARTRVLERILEHHKGLQIIDIRTELARMRMVKQAPELQALQAAIDITCETLNEVLILPQVGQYKFEYQLEADIFRGFRNRGATGHSFEPIVAAGKNACTLHNIANNDSLKNNDMVVVDVGSEFEHYAADITRTVSNGIPSTRQQAVYAAVEEVQNYALNLLEPGLLLQEYEAKVATKMGQQLESLKLCKSPDAADIRKYFPHATSHFLGLNVHDVGDYTKPLVEDIVLTCEPGIYIAEEAIGVRLEDDVLITKSGNKVLSAACRKQLSSATL